MRGGLEVGLSFRVWYDPCRKFFGLLSACALALLCLSCATTAKYKRHVDQWVGRSQDELIQSWGSPEASRTLENGNRILSYHAWKMEHPKIPERTEPVKDDRQILKGPYDCKNDVSGITCKVDKPIVEIPISKYATLPIGKATEVEYVGAHREAPLGSPLDLGECSTYCEVDSKATIVAVSFSGKGCVEE